MHPLKTFLLCAGFASGNAVAMEVSLIADYWDYSVEGSVNLSGSVQDLERDLGVEAQGHTTFHFAWNTGTGWWRPDFAASYTAIKANGQRSAEGGGGLGGVLFPPSGSVARGDADLDDTDLTLRYPWTLGRARVWGGVTLKRIVGVVAVQDPSDSAEVRQRVDQVFPLLHLAARWPLASWIELAAQGNAVSYQDDSAYEFRASANLNLPGPLGIDLGWQLKRYDITDADYQFDATLSGPFIGAFVAFD